MYLPNAENGRSRTDRYSGYRISLKICLGYAVLGSLWILFSDRLAVIIAADMNELQIINTYKGWTFVLATASLLYFLIQHFLRRLLDSNKQLVAAHWELESSYAEIAAAGEELRQQYDELEKQAGALMISEWNYRNLFDNMLNAFALHELICDDQGKPINYRFLTVNPAFERLTGLQASEVIGKTVLDVLPHTEPYWIQAYGEVALNGAPCSFIQFSRDLNRYFEIEAYCPERGKFAVQFLDCTERVKHHEEVERMAYYDALTNLPNRYLLQDRLQKSLAAAAGNNEKLAVMLLDLDDFKLVNDTLGHFAGDDLLKVIGERLSALLDKEDTIARLGGDEFMILVKNVDGLQQLNIIAEQIIKAVEQPWYYNGSLFHMTCKLGISLYPDSSRDAATLMKQADIAMYKAKDHGKGYYQYYAADMEAQVTRRMQIEAELHTAIKENQLVLFYQPQVNSEGTIVGVEALLRWQHPVKGLIPPLDFIPVAEETGLITKIGEWVLRTACRQSKDWQNAGLPQLYMAINLSARQFRQQNLLAFISQVVEEAGIDPETLVLEITETIAMENADYTIQMLEALQAKGIQIALDDFGIGYSSLIYLMRFPINSLKIDRSFIQDIHMQSEGAIIAKTILALAKNLKYAVVAEGVETVEQLEFLKELQCDYMQGYLFSKPLPAYDMTALLIESATKPPAYCFKKPGTV